MADNDLSNDVSQRLLDLMSELGEVAKEFLKGTDYGKAKFQATANWSYEIGDLFFSFLCVANATDVDVDDSLEQVFAKYAQRVAAQGDPGSRSSNAL